jgi:hypothetical protein
MREFVIKWGLPSVAFLLPWQTRWIFYETLLGGQPFDFGALSLYAAELLLLAVVLLSGRPIWAMKVHRPVKWSLLLLIVAGVSVISADNQFLALIALMHLAFAVIFFVALLDERVELRRVLIGFCAGLVIPSFLGLWQFFTGGSSESTLLGLATRDSARLGEAVFELNDQRVLRAYGSFGHPNIFGGYLAVGIFGLLHLWRGESAKLDRYLMVSGLALFSVALIATGSRSAILGLIVGLIVWQLKSKNGRSAKKCFHIFVPIFALLLFIGWPLISSRSNLSSAIESRSIIERLEQYQDFSQVVAGQWFFGQGIGNYTLASREAFPDREWWQYQPIHNVLLLIVGEIGLIGLACALLFVVSLAQTGFSFGAVIIVVALFDHYPWSLWSGSALVALVAGLSARYREE